MARWGPLVVALEQPTNAARATVFAADTSEMLTYHQIPVESYHPDEGWVEQDPLQILHAILECIEVALDNLRKLDIDVEDIVTVGITNQRETVVVWDVKTGRPLHNAIVWMDMRSSDIVEDLLKSGQRTIEEIRSKCGLPLSTYFSAPKLRWMLDNVPEIKSAIKNGTCRAGTIDSWLIWNLTGGNKGGVHMTDVTNASRTMLMDLESCTWDPYLCETFGVPQDILPTIRSSSEIYGYIFTGSLTGIPVSGCLGDQQAALVGQMCIEFGQTKCTFGTGAFLLCNTGTSVIKSRNGLLTTVAYKFGPKNRTTYALEGSGIIAGITLDWLKNDIANVDNGNINNYENKEKKFKLESNSKRNAELLKKLSSQLDDEDPDEDGSFYFVPAFSGLYAPYWRKDARGIICGLSPKSDINHLVRATSRALGFQTRAVLEALEDDCRCSIKRLLVDGTLATNTSLMQIQADISGVTIVRPIMPESSALGAAIAAGSAFGINLWPRTMLPPPSDMFYPTMSEDERDVLYGRWNATVEKSFGWVPKELPLYAVKNESDIIKNKIYSSIPIGLFMLSSFFMLCLANKLKS